MSDTNILEKNNENTNLIKEKLLKQEQKDFPWREMKIIEIKTWVYWVEFKSWNIWYYLDNEWEITFSHSRAIFLPWYKEKLEKLWYKEEKIWTEYIMTRINDNSKVDKYSIEYYNIFVDLDFDFSLKYLDEAINSKKRLSRSQALELLPTFISAWSLKINELESFLERWSITKEDFENFLPKMRILLKKQTIDERWNMKKFWKEVIEEEISSYFEKWYINKNEELELYEIIKKRSRNSEQKEKIKKQTYFNLEAEKNKFSV